ncbi:MAG: helicase associated domain-containing protein [Verrucomicrobia bacterium]|nr:helicase associated domain-containing protein [Verrucomicrobiota bacterium]
MRFRERVEILGPEISQAELRKAITTACVESLGCSWDEYLGQLKAFKERFGDCNVPQKWDENPALSVWANNQRQRNRLGKLSPERRQKLNELGFVWNIFDATWEEYFARLVVYKQQQGHCNVQRNQAEDRELGNWVHALRRNRKDGRLNAEQIRRLTELGLVWDTFEAAWLEMFAALQAYKQTHKDCNVPQGWKENPRLASWVSTQRKLKNKGQLSEDRVRRLDQECFIWDRLEAAWEQMFEMLKQYKSAHYNCNVPARWPENPELATWVHEQRRKKRRGRLHESRIQRLTELGFRWEAESRPSAQTQR